MPFSPSKFEKIAASSMRVVMLVSVHSPLLDSVPFLFSFSLHIYDRITQTPASLLHLQHRRPIGIPGSVLDARRCPQDLVSCHSDCVSSAWIVFAIVAVLFAPKIYGLNFSGAADQEKDGHFQFDRCVFVCFFFFLHLLLHGCVCIVGVLWFSNNLTQDMFRGTRKGNSKEKVTCNKKNGEQMSSGFGSWEHTGYSCPLISLSLSLSICFAVYCF